MSRASPPAGGGGVPRSSPDPAPTEHPLTRRPEFPEPTPRDQVKPWDAGSDSARSRIDAESLVRPGAKRTHSAELVRWAVGAIVAILVLGSLCVVAFFIYTAASKPAAAPLLQQTPAAALADAALVARRTATAVAANGIAMSPLLGSGSGDMILSLRANVPMPASKPSVYYCQAFSLKSRLSSTYHATRFEGLVLSPHLHHMLLFGCFKPVEARQYEKPYECPSMDEVPCRVIIAGTADLPDSLEFPPSAGMPMGTGDYGDVYTDVLLQWHFTPKAAGQVDQSGFDIHLTPRLRPSGVGSIAMWYPTHLYTLEGTALAQDIRKGSIPSDVFNPNVTFGVVPYLLAESPTIPPRTPAHEVVVVCPPIFAPGSLGYSIPAEGANLTHVWPHMHLTGARIWAELYRRSPAAGANGTRPWRFVRELYRWDSFFFHGQRFFPIEPQIALYPTDLIILHCVFNTTSRADETWIGNEIMDEMCNLFLVTVPRLPFARVSVLAKAVGDDATLAMEKGSLCLGGVAGWPELSRVVLG